MKKISVFLFIIICLSNGCTMDLDLSPKDSLSDATFWKSVEDFEKGANALYGVLPGFSVWDTDADIAYANPNSVSNSTLTVPDTDGNWNNAYTQIRNCNNLLEKAQNPPAIGDIKVPVAEAKFFRAWNYWSLYRLYGGVPVVTKVLDINSEELYGPRASAQETVDFIIKDLREAAPDLPDEKSLSIAQKGHVTRGAANALLARVALYEGTWRKFRNDGSANEYLDIAIEASNTVIGSDQYELFTSQGADSYRLLFIDEGDNAPECILDLRYESFVRAHGFPAEITRGWGPTKQLADMYLCSDGLPVDKSSLFQGYETFVSEFESRDPRMTQTLFIPGTEYWATNATPLYYYPYWPFFPLRSVNTGYMIFKFQTQDPDFIHDGTWNQVGYDHHIIRYAEILLIYAEAVYEKNGSISDADLDKTVNLLRRRVGFDVALTNAFVTANGLNMREEIRRERTVELALEGFRWDDLRRWKTAETVLPQAIRGVKIVGTQWGTEPIIVNGAERNEYRNAEWQSRTDAGGFIISESAVDRSSFNPDKNYLMPIPAKELQLNPQLQQNPGWK